MVFLAQSGGGWQTLIMFGLVAVVFWFFMIRPQMRKQKELKKFREGLQKGDKVVTVGGIHGKVLEIQDNTVLIATEGSGKLRVETSAVSMNAEDQLANKK